MSADVEYWDEATQEWRTAPYSTKLIGKIIIFPWFHVGSEDDPQ